MASYIYDLAQLIHQQGLAPVDIVAHSLGGNIAVRYAGIYPDAVRRLVAIEGIGPGPSRHTDAGRKPIAERMRGWIDAAARLAGAAAAPLRHAGGCAGADAGGEQAPVPGAGAASDAARR